MTDVHVRLPTVIALVAIASAAAFAAGRSTSSSSYSSPSVAADPVPAAPIGHDPLHYPGAVLHEGSMLRGQASLSLLKNQSRFRARSPWHSSEMPKYERSMPNSVLRKRKLSKRPV